MMNLLPHWLPRTKKKLINVVTEAQQAWIDYFFVIVHFTFVKDSIFYLNVFNLKVC